MIVGFFCLLYLYIDKSINIINMASYTINTFVRTPSQGDTYIKIYNKYNKLIYSIDPNIVSFYKSSNILSIKVNDSNDVFLDFETASECNDALLKLNSIKQTLISMVESSGVTNLKTNVFSKNNLNMSANITTHDGDLACDNSIIDIPISNSLVRVFINGLEVNVGGKMFPYECYFSNDGINVRNIGDERQGDKLYWNGTIANYQLDQNDSIDFIYLTNIK